MMTQAETLTVASVGRLMRDPSTYSDHPSLVEVIETHLSWVFLTSRHAYKLKKPLRFEFVDLTRIAARRQACEVVKMQRLPAECALDRLVRSQQVNDVDVDRISRTLVAFYGLLVPLVIPTHQYPDQIQRHVRANWQDLQSVDCLEFSEELRQVDVADELAFFAMAQALVDRTACRWLQTDRLRLQRQEEEPDRRPLPTLDVDMTKGIGPALDALFPALAKSLEPASPLDGRPDHKLGCAGQEGVVP